MEAGPAGGPGGGLAYCAAAGWHARGLQRLNLAHNRLATLPASVSVLGGLTGLCVADNALVALPETLSALTLLRTLDVSRNLLTVLPAGLGRAAALERAAAHHNPLLAPPPEILRRPAAAAVAYLRGVHAARSTGRLDWNGLGLMTADTLPVMLPDGEAGLLREVHLDRNLLVVLHPAVLRQLPCLEVPLPPPIRRSLLRVGFYFISFEGFILIKKFHSQLYLFSYLSARLCYFLSLPMPLPPPKRKPGSWRPLLSSSHL